MSDFEKIFGKSVENMPEYQIGLLRDRVSALEGRADAHKKNFERVNELLKQMIGRIEEQEKTIKTLQANQDLTTQALGKLTGVVEKVSDLLNRVTAFVGGPSFGGGN